MSDHANMKFHESTYKGMLTFLKWGTVVAAVLTAIVISLIAS